jgi:hypothetical protein
MAKNPKVDAYMKDLDNPMKDLWEEIRKIVTSLLPSENDQKDA